MTNTSTSPTEMPFEGLPPGRVKKLIKHLGGRTDLCRRLKIHGIEIPLSTIGSWITRNSIPANRIKALDKVGEDIKKPIDWNKVLTK